MNIHANEFALKEPEDYRKLFIENLPTDWSDNDIRIRLEQLGSLDNLHIIKNSIGQNTGRVLAVYRNMDSLIEAIKNFKDKMPWFKPVKIRFFKEFKNEKIDNSKKEKLLKTNVLLIKNLPENLHKNDLNLFLSEFHEPLHISYLRDHKNEFKRSALAYYYKIEDAEKVLSYANLRYVHNKQMFIQFSYNHYDLFDFRTRIELGINLPPKLEIPLYRKQIENYKLFLTSKGEYSDSDVEKIEYLKACVRKLEFKLKAMGEQVETLNLESTELIKQSKNKKIRYESSRKGNLIFADSKKLL